MTQNSIEVSGIHVEVVRKRIKYLYVRVYAPEGQVRVVAPLRVDDEAVRRAVLDKLDWIRRHQARFAAQAQRPAREMVSGESHDFRGQRYLLHVTERDDRPGVALRGNGTLTLAVRPGATAAQRKAVLDGWYRQELKRLLPGLIAKWEPVMGVQVAEWGVKRMKTRWGSCNVEARRIWLNLELIKKPPHCLEYVVVHEMVHLLERLHNRRFQGFMDQFLPHWRLYRDELNQAPLGREEWDY